MKRHEISWKPVLLLSAILLGAVASLATATAEPANKYKSRPKGSVTYNKDIAPLIYQNCTVCHREGEVAPFTLATYNDIKKRAKQIVAVTQKGIMPPWHAEAGFGEFSNARFLTPEQRGLMEQWMLDGMPVGKASDLPPKPTYPKGWTIGTPDLVVEPEQEFTVSATGDDIFQCFVIPTNYSEDRYIRSVEVRPGSAAVVHHVLAFLDTTGQARKLDTADPSYGYSSYGGIGFMPSGVVAGWAPGNDPYKLPEGLGVLLPKGADIVLQVHYHKTGKVEKDRTRVGLSFQKKPVDKRIRTAMVINPFFRIPAGAEAHEVKAGTRLPGNVTLLSVTPHMHLLGREMTLVAKKPSGEKIPLVRVPNWNYKWQTTYDFKTPISVPQDTRIELVAKYDNSTKNPLNPSSPPKAVSWGEQTTDEMCIAFVSYTVDDEHLTKGVEASGYPEFGGGRRSRARLRR